MREVHLGEGKKAMPIPLGRFESFDDAHTFEEEIKYDCWVTYVVERRRDV